MGKGKSVRPNHLCIWTVREGEQKAEYMDSNAEQHHNVTDDKEEVRHHEHVETVGKRERDVQMETERIDGVYYANCLKKDSGVEMSRVLYCWDVEL